MTGKEREKVTEMIIDDDFASIKRGFEDGDGSYLYDLLTSGMIGYYNFTDEELEQELRERNIKLK